MIIIWVFIFIDIQKFHNSDIESLQMMLTTGIGSPNKDLIEGLALVRKRIVEVQNDASSFFRCVAHQLDANPRTQGTYSHTALRIHLVNFFIKERSKLEVNSI